MGHLLSKVIRTIDYAFCPKIPAIDNLFPVIPVFVIIYIFSYVFWIYGPMAVSKTKPENFINYVIGLICAYSISFIIFAFFPSTMDRTAEGLFEIVERPGILNRLLGLIYTHDGGAFGFDLFPSFHCLSSLYCYLGVRKQPEISKGFKIYSLIMTVLICLSTLFTKQHYFVDTISGLGIAAACYLVTKRINPGKRLLKQ